MTELIYFLVILFATFIGASAGIGGGVIIKPALDAINISDISTISFVSSCSVLTMAVYSSIKERKHVENFDSKTVYLIGIGSVFGGIVGSRIFSHIVEISQPNAVKAFQSFFLALLLIGVLLNIIFKFKTFNIKNKFFILLIGFLLGITSSFLGIGGGPINVAVFITLFSCDIKNAAIYSLTTIIFTQTSSLITLYLTKGFSQFNLKILFFALPAALLGGFLGSRFNQKATSETISKMFIFTTIGVIILNIFNLFVALGVM